MARSGMLFLLLTSCVVAHLAVTGADITLVGSAKKTYSGVSLKTTRQVRPPAELRAAQQTALAKLQSMPGMKVAARVLARMFDTPIPTSDCTYFVPVSLGQIFFLFKSLDSTLQTQILSYHILPSVQTFGNISSLDDSATLATVEGSNIVKRGAPGSWFFLLDKGPLPKLLLLPNVVATEKLAVHIISQVMIPPDFTGP